MAFVAIVPYARQIIRLKTSNKGGEMSQMKFIRTVLVVLILWAVNIFPVFLINVFDSMGYGIIGWVIAVAWYSLLIKTVYKRI